MFIQNVELDIPTERCDLECNPIDEHTIYHDFLQKFVQSLKSTKKLGILRYFSYFSKHVGD